MNTADNDRVNIKSVFVIIIVSTILFGIFYYLITDISNGSSIKDSGSLTNSNNKEALNTAPPQSAHDNVLAASTSTDEKNGFAETKPDDSASIFGTLNKMKPNVQPESVLSGEDVREGTEATVPATGSDTIFAAFVVSCLVMFTGIYMLVANPRRVALSRFEKRIIRDLD